MCTLVQTLYIAEKQYYYNTDETTQYDVQNDGRIKLHLSLSLFFSPLTFAFTEFSEIPKINIAYNRK